jgi:hypothetical protein
MLPPELDFFNRAPEPPAADSSSEEDSDRDEAKAKKAAAGRKDASTPAKKFKKPLPASVQAMKKKYTEQLLAKKVVSSNILRQGRAADTDLRRTGTRASMATRSGR